MVKALEKRSLVSPFAIKLQTLPRNGFSNRPVRKYLPAESIITNLNDAFWWAIETITTVAMENFIQLPP